MIAMTNAPRSRLQQHLGLPKLAQTGFTLVELLVAMSLLALIMVALGATLRTFGAAEQRIDRHAERSDDFRIATQFMRSTLERISLRPTDAPKQAGVREDLFAATSNALAWVGIMPARFGAGGKYFFRLGIESIEGQPALVIRYSPWQDKPAFPNWSQADSRVLAAPVTVLEFAYEVDTPGNTAWVANWTIPDKFPQHVRLRIRGPGRNWPDLTFALSALPQSSGANAGGVTFGPGHR